MKTVFKVPVFLIFAFLLALGCNSDDNTIIIDDEDVSRTDDDPTPGDGGGSGGTIGMENIEIRVDLPKDMDLDISNTYLESVLTEYKVESDNTANIQILKDKRSLVYLRNSDGEIVLMGFVSKDMPVIDAGSTFEASIFYRLGTVFRLPELKEKFLNEFRTLGEVEPYVAQLEEMYKTDPLLLKSDAYTTWLNDAANRLLGNKKVIDLESKILFPDNSTKSGIKIDQNGDDIFSTDFHNFYRRRARAFFYKVAVKRNGEFETILDLDKVITSYQTSLEPDVEQDISPVTGLTSIQGGVIDVALGNGANMGFVTSGPTKLKLLDGDEASKYAIRVLGPGQKSTRIHTFQEGSALLKMQLETFLLDFFIPAITTSLSIGDIADTYIDAIDINTGIELVNAALASTPGALDALDEGEFVTALVEFIKAFVGNYGGTEDFFDMMVVQPLTKLKLYKNVDDLAARLAAPLTITNAFLASVDGYRIVTDINVSSQLEQFEAIVSRSKVRIDPTGTGIVKGEKVTLTAKILDDGNVQPGEYSYKWRTTGLYGSLKEDPGTETNVYESDPNAALPPNAKDSIFVEIRKDDILVGKDSTTINISPTKYRIRPDGLTLNGGNEVRLSIVDEQAKRLTNDETIKYKVVWSIDGQYGKLNGRDIQATTEEDHTMPYHCFDKETKNGVEKISAKIYWAVYNESTNVWSEYEPYDEIEAEIKIENDPLKLIYYTNKITAEGYVTESGIWCNYTVSNFWRWNPAEAQGDIPEGFEVDRIQMAVEEYSYYNSCRVSDTWYPGNEAEDLVEIEEEGGTTTSYYELECWRNSGSGPGYGDCSGAEASLAERIAFWGAQTGYAKVTVYLKPKS